MTSARRKTPARPGTDVPGPRWQVPVGPAPAGPAGSGPAHAALAAVAPGESPRVSRAETVRRSRQSAVSAVLNAGGPEIVFQPQLSLSRMALSGYEALARFPGSSPSERGRGTYAWFMMAHEVGLGDQLEAAALERALAARDRRPTGTSLAVNVSPAVLTRPAVTRALPADLTGIEVELTEHEWVTGNARLRRELDLLRERGARIAIDDVGVAHSGLRRVMELAPDRIKLDRHLVRGVSSSSAKAALIRSVVDFAEQVHCDVCAEGVETLDDLETLAELDVGYAQGWTIGRPSSEFLDVSPEAVAASQESLRGLLTSPVPGSGAMQFDAAVGVEHMLARLASVTSLQQLARLISTYAGVLGADLLVISMLTPDGAALRSLDGPFGLALGDPYRLDDYPLTEQAIRMRTIAPMYLPGGLAESSPGTSAIPPQEAWLRGGDAAEWEVMRSLNMESALMVPVISRDRAIGLLECYGESTARWSRRQIRSARTVAAMLGPVLDVLLTRA